MELLSESKEIQLTSNLLSHRQETPLVGDYLVVINPDFLLSEHKNQYSRNTVFTLYRIKGMTKHSVYTYTDGNAGRLPYYRWEKEEDGGVLVIKSHKLNLMSPFFLRQDMLFSVGYHGFLPDGFHLPRKPVFRSRNTVECVSCGCQIQFYRLHPHPDETLIPPQEWFNCEDCYLRNSTAKIDSPQSPSA